jgi:hypothetical protein
VVGTATDTSLTSNTNSNSSSDRFSLAELLLTVLGPW